LTSNTVALLSKTGEGFGVRASGMVAVRPSPQRYTSQEIGVGAEREVRTMPEWLLGIIQAGLTVIALIVIIMLLAGLFMIIFGIATGIDERIQD
jgi:hypothetical protein